MKIKEFCDLHQACAAGREWALQHCASMEDAWQKLRPEWLRWVASRKGVLTDRELRLFAVFCARQVRHLMKDERSIRAIDVAESFANGTATDEELAEARKAAFAAFAAAFAADAAFAAAFAAFAAAFAADVAAAAADRAAADAAADAAAAAADAAAESQAARNKIMNEQSAWLRENTKPNFS